MSLTENQILLFYKNLKGNAERKRFRQILKDEYGIPEVNFRNWMRKGFIPKPENKDKIKNCIVKYFI